MWHEARKQEKKIRGMIVDYRKRADRRKEFYERIVSFLAVECDMFVQLFSFLFVNRERIQRNFFKFMDVNTR